MKRNGISHALQEEMNMRRLSSVFLWIICSMMFVFSSAEGSSPRRALQKTVMEMNAILEKQRKILNLPPVAPAEDAVFFRRIWLNGAGRLPTEKEVREFLRSTKPDKRSEAIEKVLASGEHADLITMRFADMLRIKSEFPVNLWPNAVQAFHYRLREDIFKNRSYGGMVREMLTSSGSNFREVYANFFRTTGDRSPEGLAAITALTFMGLRLEKLPEKERKAFSGFFSRIRYKSTSEWKEEIVYTDPAEAVVYAALPGCSSFTIHSPATDPRQVLAKALIDGDNVYLARAFVNRAWSWFFGKGFTEEADDLEVERGGLSSFLETLGFGKPKQHIVQKDLLDFLTKEFRSSGYDMRHLFRLIMNSSAYGSSSRADQKIHAVLEKHFYTYPIRRMEAEIISDCLGALTGVYGKYSSVIPEPFTYLPAGTKAVQVADGSISSAFLDQFGRPSRDTGKISDRRNFITASQRLYLLNSGTLYNELNRQGWRIAREVRWNLRKGVERFYLTALSRYPTEKEFHLVQTYYNKLPKKQKGRVWPDLIWVLANSKEFLYYH